MTNFACFRCGRTIGNVRLVEHGTDDMQLCKHCFLAILTAVRDGRLRIEDPDDDDGDVPESVPDALDAGWRPRSTGDVPDDAEWSEYAWGLIPCPHCDTGMLLGVYDPDDALDGENVSMATLLPPGHDEYPEGDDD